MNTVWVSDITYILTDEGWRYLTVILDLADRAVVSWILSQTMHAQCTVVPAFKQAIERRRVRPHSGLMFHSDRGVQYACEDFRTILAHYGIAQSMSRKGNCWDNAVAESFFKTIKTEELNRFKLIRATQLNSLIFKYIEGWYNTQRIHSTLRGLTLGKPFMKKLQDWPLNLFLVSTIVRKSIQATGKMTNRINPFQSHQSYQSPTQSYQSLNRINPSILLNRINPSVSNVQFLSVQYAVPEFPPFLEPVFSASRLDRPQNRGAGEGCSASQRLIFSAQWVNIRLPSVITRMSTKGVSAVRALAKKPPLGPFVESTIP
ncbi:MAG: IS3 family transposase [Lewinellaceae bacterium]|nr:IS3 family transposase [Lewinellaceae bacterium]